MDVSGPNSVGQQYSVGVAVKAMRAAKAQGEGEVELIKAAKSATPPPGLHGQGTHINTYG